MAHGTGGYKRVTVYVNETEGQGEKGGETPRVYLSDGTRRKGVALATYTTVGTDWKEVKIPLADFADKGIDLTHLEGLEVIFEWAAMSGTIWLDDIAFE